MRYGRFDEENREYVIERVDLPVSWTNYIGTKKMCGVFNHTAGGYLYYDSPEYHRITRFRPNGVPMDGPGHYVYVRDDETGDYWSISWQPVGKSLDAASYVCRHGFSYTKYECVYDNIAAEQTLFIAEDDPVEIIDVKLKNTGAAVRNVSLFSYVEFSFHQIDMDNKNFQMSLYAAGSRYEDGTIIHDLHYEENSHQFLTANFKPDGFEALRDNFIGPYRTERNPIGVEKGKLSGGFENGNNHCGALHKKITLQPGEEQRIVFLLGEGGAVNARKMRAKYGDPDAVDAQFKKLRAFWDDKCERLQIDTPNAGLNALTNQWTLYQSEINVMFSRFSSFIEVGGRTGLGYRDTAQDAMSIPHSNPDKCRSRMIELLRALTTSGYGLHLFEPRWFDPDQKQQSFKSPTVVPTPQREDIVHGLDDACSDDALWLVAAIVNYVKETGDIDFCNLTLGYADGGAGTVYEHMKKIIDFTTREVGQNGIAKGLRADWNDCLNLGGGESAMVSFLHYWALQQFVELARYLGNTKDVDDYAATAESVRRTCEDVLWDGEWYIRGITADGRKIGTKTDEEGRIHLESNAWAVLSGVARGERAQKVLASVEAHLSTPYGLMLNAPPYTKIDDGIGFITRVYPGLKENGAIFSHANPWMWAAACRTGQGATAMRFYDALCPYHQNDKIEIRQSEPYSYCQFIVGKAHSAFGRARHPFMTGSAGWAFFATTQYILGLRPDFDGLIIDPCIPADWTQFKMTRVWRDVRYEIVVKNPQGVEKGVTSIHADGVLVTKLPILPPGRVCEVTVEMGVIQ